MGNTRTIGQALSAHWKEEKKKDTDHSGVIPLLPYLKYQYDHRYVALCERVGVEPKTFPKWLLTPVDSL